MAATSTPQSDAEPDTAGDRRVWLAQIFPIVAGWCARLGGCRIDVEEATNDILLILVRREADLREGVRLEAWAYGITKGVVANHRRRAWFRRWVPGAPVEAISPRSPLLDVERLDTARRVDALMERLSSDHREILILCDVEERASSEVAVLMGIPEGTVRSRLRSARARFRELAPSFHLHAPSDGSDS